MYNFTDYDIDEDVLRFNELAKKGIKVFLVEGDSDVRAFNFMEAVNDRIRIFECDGKENVIKLISQPELKNNPNICAFIDKDYDDLMSILYSVENLIISEYPSLEYYLLKTEGFNKWLNDIKVKSKVDKLKSNYLNNVVCKACKTLQLISLIRYYNSINSNNIKFNEFIGLKSKILDGKKYYDLTNRYKAVGKMLIVKSDDISSNNTRIFDLINSKLHTCSENVNKEELKSFLQSNLEKESHIAAQGHDLLSAVVCIINHISDDSIELNDPTLESILRSHFGVEEMKKHCSTNRVFEWAIS